jgi:hypothetical protein
MIKHAYNNPKADGGDTTIARPSDWNADHVITGDITLPAQLTFTLGHIFNSAGNVGIGTTSPTAFGANWRSVEVAGQDTSSGGVFRTRVSDSSIIADFFTGSAFGGAVLRTTTLHAITFYTNSLQRMQILSSGQVGIGMNGDTGTNLAVSGNASIVGAAGSSRDFRFYSGTTAAAAGLRWVLRCESTAEAGSNAGSDFQLIGRDDSGANLGVYMVVNRSNGNVAFGGASPGAASTGYLNMYIGKSATILADKGLGANLSFQHSQNAEYVGGAWQYINTDKASSFCLTAGRFAIRQAASGTAGTGLTWTENLALSNTGHFTINPGAIGAAITGRVMINAKPVDDNSFAWDSESVLLTHPTATATATLNDPKDVLYLNRIGTTGQAYAASASFSLSRYQNAGTGSTGSRTRLDINLTHDAFNFVKVAEAHSDGSWAFTGVVTGSNLSGTNTGDQTITLTGDVTGSGTGSFATAIKASVSLTTPIIGAATGTSLALTGALTSSGGGIGYATGAGGTISQGTSKVTGVTLNKLCGTITMFTDSIAAAGTKTFVFTNSFIAATDVIHLQHDSVGTIGAYTLNASAMAAGTCNISIRNNTAGALAEGIVLRFVIIKAVVT